MVDFCLKSDEDLDFLKNIFDVLSDKNRMKIICILKKGKPLCVCEIVKIFNLKQNLISHHLQVLKKVYLLETQRRGKYIYYKINLENYNKIKLLIGKLFNI